MVPHLVALPACSFPGTLLCAGIHLILIWHPRFLTLVVCANISSLISGPFPFVKFSTVNTNASKFVRVLSLMGGFSAVFYSALWIPVSPAVHTDVWSAVWNPLLIFRPEITIPALVPDFFFDLSVYNIRLSRLSSSMYSSVIPWASKSSVFLFCSSDWCLGMGVCIPSMGMLVYIFLSPPVARLGRQFSISSAAAHPAGPWILALVFFSICFDYPRILDMLGVSHPVMLGTSHCMLLFTSQAEWW